MKKYNVLGIGNAVVDVISQSSDIFLKKMNIEKGIMQLVDRNRGELLYNSMDNRKQAPGGSVANTIAGIGALGLKTGFIGKVGNDELGNFYVGSQFKVDQATGNVTLDASAFNLSGLESFRLGSVGGLIGASVNEFSTDGTLSQNRNTKVPTQNAVKTYVDGQISGLNADKIIEGDTSVETIDSASDGNIQFKINAQMKLQIDSNGHTIPGADNASDLGSSTKRWRNIYAADMHYSNEGDKNSDDGTWGSYTIQEGENDLFLLNNRNGKKYKYNLTEVN